MSFTPQGLLPLLRGIKEKEKGINRIFSSLLVYGESLSELVDGYMKERKELIEHEIVERKITWCTHCSTLISRNGARLVFIEGVEIENGSDQTYGYRSFWEIHQVCHACKNKFFEKHGWRGQEGKSPKETESFLAFSVKKEENGIFLARKFGEWVDVSSAKNMFSGGPSDELLDEFAKNYNLPPRVKVVMHERSYIKPRLVFYPEEAT